MIPWMLWATATSALLGLAALLGERLLRASGRAGRWAWVMALSGGAGLQVGSLLRRDAGHVAVIGGDGGISMGPAIAWEAMDGAIDMAGTLPAWLDTAVLITWASFSAVLAVAVLGGLWRLGRKAARWPRLRIGGEDVLLSDDFGPALVGFRSPTIVLPRSLVALRPDAVAMACRHEAEHRDAYDGWLIMAAALAWVAAPWNAALWWIAARLRHAVELDCDGRVLRSGVDRGAYGSLLLELGATGSALLPAVPGLAHPPSLLERRLVMMTNGVRIGGRLGAVAAAAVAVLLVAVACATEAPDPTAPVAQEVTSRVDVVPPDAADIQRFVPGQPLIYVDGIQVTPDGGGGYARTLDELDVDDIESIEVIKGPAAQRLYGEKAAEGVIQIHTKGADSPRLTGDAAVLEEASALAREAEAARAAASTTRIAEAAPGPSEPGAVENQRIAVTGHVVSAETGQPVGAAQVYIEEAQTGSLTRPDGSYLLYIRRGDDWVGREVAVRAQRLGFGATERTVTLSAGTQTVDLTLDGG